MPYLDCKKGSNILIAIIIIIIIILIVTMICYSVNNTNNKCKKMNNFQYENKLTSSGSG